MPGPCYADAMITFVLIVAAAFVFYVVPGWLLWQRRAAVPLEWLIAAAVAVLVAPMLGQLFVWYVAMRAVAR